MGQTIQVALDDQGRILIPASIAGSLGLVAGTTLVAEEESDGAVRLHVEPQATLLVNKGGVLVARAAPSGDLSDVTRRERDQRTLELAERTGL